VDAVLPELRDVRTVVEAIAAAAAAPTATDAAAADGHDAPADAIAEQTALGLRR